MSVERRIQKLEEEVRWLRRQLAHVPVRVTPGGGGGGNGFHFYTGYNRSWLQYTHGEVDAPALGYTTQYGIYYVKIGEAWVSYTHLE